MEKTNETTQNEARVLPYIIGFLSAIALTVGAYLIVVEHWLSGSLLVAAIVGLAVVQLFMQLVFFLHLGRETKPRWNLAVFCFMLMVLVLIVGGSLWIMGNLNYNMQMTPVQMDKYMTQQSNEGF